MIYCVSVMCTFFFRCQGFSGQPKGEGIKYIIEQCLAEEYPDVHPNDWTPKMMRDIKEKILEKMRGFMTQEKAED